MCITKDKEDTTMREEIIFSYNNTRCHAEIIEKLSGGEKYIGSLDGYEIYRKADSILFDQFGFVAIKE